MVVWFALARGGGRLAAVGYGHSVAYLGGTVALAACLRGRMAGAGHAGRVAGSVARSLACAAAAGALAYLLGHAAGTGRAATAVAVTAAAGAGTCAYLALQRAFDARELAWLRQPASAASPPAGAEGAEGAE
jgi:hypothetical protein